MCPRLCHSPKARKRHSRLETFQCPSEWRRDQNQADQHTPQEYEGYQHLVGEPTDPRVFGKADSIWRITNRAMELLLVALLSWSWKSTGVEAPGKGVIQMAVNTWQVAVARKKGCKLLFPMFFFLFFFVGFSRDRNWGTNGRTWKATQERNATKMFFQAVFIIVANYSVRKESNVSVKNSTQCINLHRWNTLFKKKPLTQQIPLRYLKHVSVRTWIKQPSGKNETPSWTTYTWKRQILYLCNQVKLWKIDNDMFTTMWLGFSVAWILF